MTTTLLQGLALCALSSLLLSCKIHSDHVIETRHEIKPIEINVNVRVERELDNFFEDIDEASSTVNVTDSESTEPVTSFDS